MNKYLILVTDKNGTILESHYVDDYIRPFARIVRKYSNSSVNIKIYEVNDFYSTSL